MFVSSFHHFFSWLLSNLKVRCCQKPEAPQDVLGAFYVSEASNFWISQKLIGKSDKRLKQTVEVVLRHFHRHRYKSSPLWFFVGEGLAHIRCKL
jgi:heme oxygenase